METTHVWQVRGMHCSSCSILIDEAVEELDGVRSSTTSLKKKLTTVTLDPARCDPDRVVEAIQEAGYQAIPASEDAAATGQRVWFRRSSS
ncbi:MAG: heavy-metal-associated domain-containing protein [Nocardioidaceae bacterium]